MPSSSLIRVLALVRLLVQAQVKTGVGVRAGVILDLYPHRAKVSGAVGDTDRASKGPCDLRIQRGQFDELRDVSVDRSKIHFVPTTSYPSRFDSGKITAKALGADGDTVGLDPAAGDLRLRFHNLNPKQDCDRDKCC